MKDKKSKYIRRWIRDLSKIRPELGNFSLCPFASTANFLIIEKKLNEIVPSSDYDVTIYIVEDHHECDYLYDVVDNYNLKYTDYKFLADHRNADTFINKVQSNNGKYNLVLVQPKKDLLEARLKLAKTNYYKNYDEDYLKEVLEDDYTVIKDEINTNIKP
jgi:hypothetical protein